MNTLRIKGREGRFEVVGADYGNYLEGYFIGPTKNHVARWMGQPVQCSISTTLASS